MLLKEGEIRIPSGCAISGFISRDGHKLNGSDVVKSISYMHDRSNGLGGGFAGYGIYPEYKDLYAFHVFYNSNTAREQTAFRRREPKQDTYQKGSRNYKRTAYMAVFRQSAAHENSVLAA